MSKLLKPVIIKFMCCGDSHTFHYNGEFYMCKCKDSGYDAGDAYTRILGNIADVVIVDEIIKEDLDSTSKC